MVLSISLLLFSCKDKDSSATPSAYPKSVDITYKVTSSNGVTKANILYLNGTGGSTTLMDQALPFTVTFTRTVNAGDYAQVSASAPQTGDIKMDILLGSDVVKTTTISGNGYISGSTIYYFQ